MSHLVTNVRAAEILAHHTDAARVRLDCGHLATPSFILVPEWETMAGTPGEGVSGWPGYATTPEGTRICGADVLIRESADMRAAASAGKPFAAYVSSDAVRVTTWPGGTLGLIMAHNATRGGWHGSEIHFYRVRDASGQWWHGRNGGPGMHITLRPSKSHD